MLEYGPSDWEDFQATSNDHPVETTNSNEDIEVFIDKQVNNGNLSKKLGMSYDSAPADFVERAAKH